MPIHTAQLAKANQASFSLVRMMASVNINSSAVVGFSPVPVSDNFFQVQLTKEQLKISFYLTLISSILLSTQLKTLMHFFKSWSESSQKLKLGNDSTSRIPAPVSLPLIGNVINLVLPGVDPFKLGMEWVLTFGGLFKATLFSHHFYVVNEPAMLKKILSSTDPRHLNKNRLTYDAAFLPIAQRGLIAAEYNVWSPHRKILSKVMGYQSLPQQLSLTSLHTKQLLRDLRSLPGQVEIGTFSEMVQYSLIQSVLDLLLGSKLLSYQEREEFHTNFQICKEISSRRVLEPWLLFRPIFWLHRPLHREYRRAEASIELFMQNALERFKRLRSEVGSEDEAKCLMGELLEAGLSNEVVIEESVTIISGSNDPTTISLNLLLLQLALHPDHQSRCREEVDQLFSRKAEVNDLDLDVDFTLEDLSSLKYLDRCIKENLRIWPTFPVFVRRLDHPIDLGENEKEPIMLPAGSNVAAAPWTLHRLPEYYPEPEKFDPDRFLPENVQGRPTYAYLPFSAGPRNCIGYKGALMIMKLMSVWILRYYQAETTVTSEDIKFTFGITLSLDKKIDLRLKRRS